LLREGTRILVVDDQEEMRDLLSDMLAGEGCAPMTVASAEDALAELARSPYDLLLTDLNMPRMDGLALLGRVRERWPRLPVVIITGYGSRSTERRVLREGARAYISKPCTLARVVGTLEGALEPDGEG
jgi:CheY-like chemotaxis protein